MASSITALQGALLRLAFPFVFVTIHAYSLSTRPAPATIAVCTDSDALKQLQQKAPNGVRVTGRACLGPCGDGPCVVVLDSENLRVVEAQTERVQGSLVPPEIFGSNPRGVYQVRTAANVKHVVRIAADTAGVEPSDESFWNVPDSELGVTSTRQPFDRPRNERKVMQRLMQFFVLAGLYQQAKYSEVDSLQLGTAFVLFLLSDLIMKENFFALFWKKIGIRRAIC